MMYFKFRVDVFYPPKYRSKFYEILNNEENKGDIKYNIRIEESAPPLELLKDIVIITASTLSILKILYDFLKTIGNEKGKVYITTKGQKFDLKAFNLDEIKIKMGDASIKRYKIRLSFPTLKEYEIKEAAHMLNFRPIHFKDKILSMDNQVQWADYDDENNEVKATIHVDDEEVNKLYEKGVPIYAIAEPIRMRKGTPNEFIIFKSLLLSLNPFPSTYKIEEF